MLRLKDGDSPPARLKPGLTPLPAVTFESVAHQPSSKDPYFVGWSPGHEMKLLTLTVGEVVSVINFTILVGKS
jgi:hypothetical protein